MKTVLNVEATLLRNRNRPLHSFVNWTALKNQGLLEVESDTCAYSAMK